MLAGILIVVINGPVFTQEPYEIDVKEGGEIFITDQDGEKVPFFGGSLRGKEDASALIPGATAFPPYDGQTPADFIMPMADNSLNESFAEALKELEESLQRQAEELELKEEDLQAFQENLHERMKEIQEELSVGAVGPKVVRKGGGFVFGDPPTAMIPGIGGFSFGQVQNSEVTAMHLSAPVPRNMVALIDALLKPFGTYEYDADNRILVMRAPAENLAKAKDFVAGLMQEYAKAEAAKKAREKDQEERRKLEESKEKIGIESLLKVGEMREGPVEGRGGPESIQIEALLLMGSKGEIADATNAGFPREATLIGLTPEDLAAFAFRGVNAVGPTVFHAVVDPSETSDENDVYLTLGGYDVGLRLRPPILEVMVERLVGIRSRRDGRRYGGGGYGGYQGQSEGERETVRMRQEKLITSKTKMIYDRPILLGSFTDGGGGSRNLDPMETVVFIIRMKKLE